MNWSPTLQFIITRILAVVMMASIFLPPDAQNSHVGCDFFLCVSSGIFWAFSDLILKERK